MKKQSIPTWLVVAALSIPLTGVARQRTIYKARPLTAADMARRSAIPEWTLPASSQSRPKGVDNSRLKYFPPVFNQRGNSCSQASGVRYAFSYEVNRLLDRAAADSPENVFSYHFTWNYLNNGIDEGSHPELGYDMMKIGGAATLADMPDESAAVSSTTWLTGYEKYLRAMRYRVAKYEKFSLKTAEGIDRLKTFVYNRGMEGSAGGVVTFSCLSGDWTEQQYDGPSVTGLRNVISKNGTDGAHALTIVGYDDTVETDIDNDGIISDDERGAFIFVNSWGSWWATEGRCYYPYKLFLLPADQGGIADLSAMALTVEPAIHQPTIIFKVRITYTSRNDLFFRLGAGESDAAVPAFELGYPMMMNQGGDCNMQGEGSADSFKTLEMAFDFSDFAEKVDLLKQPKFFLNVRKLAVGKVGEGQIDEMTVLDLRTGKEYVCTAKNVAIAAETLLSTNDSTNPETSANPTSWLRSDGRPVKAPFLLRDAAGGQFKLQFESLDPDTENLTIRFQKLP